MKRIFLALVLSMSAMLIPMTVSAQTEEPTIYVIKKGDTLWGISERFIKDPHYWPNLWAKNQSITNPHLIYPGQQLRIYPDRIEVVPAPEATPKEWAEEQVAKEKAITATGKEGFVLDPDLQTVGTIIQTNHNRVLLGEDDVVYTDIGTSQGAKSGDRYSIFRKAKRVEHPVTGEFMGYKYLSLGDLKLAEMEEKGSRARIKKSYLEINIGDELMPYRDMKREISLKAASKELHGYIIESRLGNILIGNFEVVYLDLGSSQGLEVGNILYVVRDVQPVEKFVKRDVGNLPQELLGALVVVETADRTSTALIIKCSETIHIGDKVTLFKK